MMKKVFSCSSIEEMPPRSRRMPRIDESVDIVIDSRRTLSRKLTTVSDLSQLKNTGKNNNGYQ